MPDIDDMDLLREYCAEQSETAFETLVQRHVNLVYSTALRQIGNPAQAEEITQAVFIILARKAARLRPGTILPAWLHETARYVTGSYLRGEIRRRRREQEAYMQSMLQPSSDESAWEQLAPLLDEAIGRLASGDRNVVILRYFQNKSTQEIATTLNVGEGAARKRLTRAVERLRLYFSRRGIDVSTSTLSGAVSAHLVLMAPAGLAKTVAATSFVKGSAASISTVTLVKGALKLMAWSKAKTAIVGGVVLVLAAATTTLVAVKMTKSQNVRPKQTLLELDSKTDSGVIADRTTPRGALLVMANAMQEGDAKAYVESCVFVGADELKLKGLLEEFVTASAKFRAAIGEKFGEKQAQATQYQMPLALPTEFLKTADVEIAGDSATVDPFKNAARGAKTRPIQMIKVGNEWKLNGFGLLPVKAAALNNVIPGIIAALNQTMAEIPQGKYMSAADAVKTMKDRADY